MRPCGRNAKRIARAEGKRVFGDTACVNMGTERVFTDAFWEMKG